MSSVVINITWHVKQELWITKWLVCLDSSSEITLSYIAAIEDDYGGPQLEDGKVTLKFMKEMMDWFKDQKKLHRKCAYQVNMFVPMKYCTLTEGNVPVI